MPTLRERFWQKVDIRGLDECWEVRSKNRTVRYLQMRTGPGKPRISSHQLAFQIWIGPIPEGLCVCHTCDNTRCVNPKHLWLGTHRENMQDKVRKERQSKGPVHGATFHGEKHGHHKLTEEQVLKIRERRKTGETYQAIAADYPVGRTQVSHICRGRDWQWL